MTTRETARPLQRLWIARGRAASLPSTYTTPRDATSEEQIIGILKEAEAGAVVTDLCRKHGMSSPTYYAWKAKFGGLEVSDAKRLRALEEEKARLKRLLADTMLDNAGLKELPLE
jgi:putative transposase